MGLLTETCSLGEYSTAYSKSCDSAVLAWEGIGDDVF